MPWRKGVLVACAPDIFYAEDRDGDGKADHREVLFTGFVEGNQQHRLNGFELGLDGWVYGANGDSGGTVRSHKTGKVTRISGRDFRFRPDTGEFEAESGQTQYGRHRDDWGHWFGNNNPNWGWHFVLSDQDLRRNPHYAAPDPQQTLEPETGCYPVSRTRRPVQRPRRGQPRHLGQQPDALPRRAVRPVVRHEPVRQRAGPQPGAPDGARARRRDLPRPSRAERVGPRVPGLERQLVPADDAQDRPRRGALGRRHVPRRSSSIPSGFPTTGRSGSTSAPAATRGGSIASTPSTRSPGRSPASTGSTRRAWSPRSTAPAAGSATRPSGCSCTAATPPHRAAPRPGRPNTKRPKTRVQAIWTLADLGGLDEPTALAGLDGSRSPGRERA